MAKRAKEKKAERSGVSAKNAVPGIVASPRLPRFSRDWFWGLILVLTVFLAYQPVWRAGYIWDDDIYITANPLMFGLHGLKEIWTTNAADISPLTFTTFWLEYALWGLAPLPFHLVNVLLHGGCAVVLWRVLRTLGMPGAWFGAALWALHPVEVESVAWVTETKNTESGLFFLLSTFFFLKWLGTVEREGRTDGGGSYALTLLFAAMAMASKSSTVVLPAVLCLCAWWMEGRWQWRNLARVAPIILMTIAASALSMWTQGTQLVDVTDPHLVRSWPERLVEAGDASWFYLGKLMWPYPLMMIYPRWQIETGQWISYVPLGAVIIVMFILWLKRESWSRPFFFVFAYFLVALLPVLGLVNNPIFRYSMVFDHFQYLASMGPLALAGVGLVWLADFVLPGRRSLQSAFGAGLLLILGGLSWGYSWNYSSQKALWTHTLIWNPDCWAGYYNLGVDCAQKGQVNEAMAHYQKALEINPNYIDARNNLGIALFQKGQVDEAILQYKKVLENDPNSEFAHHNLGTALLQKGQVDEAMAEYQKALEINPNITQIHYDFGNALFQKGRVEEAIAEYQKALEVDPTYAKAYNNLGVALSQKGQIDEAMAEYRKALEIDPNSAEFHNNLGLALAQEGQMEHALAQFQEAARLDPADRDAQQNLARAQAMLRQRATQK